MMILWVGTNIIIANNIYLRGSNQYIVRITRVRNARRTDVGFDARDWIRRYLTGCWGRSLTTYISKNNCYIQVNSFRLLYHLLLFEHTTKQDNWIAIEGDYQRTIMSLCWPRRIRHKMNASTLISVHVWPYLGWKIWNSAEKLVSSKNC